MTQAADITDTTGAVHPLCTRFVKWQCRVRQMAMRDHQGRPDDAITPQVYLPGETDPMGRIVTVLNKTAASSMTPELLHIARRTNDPAQIRSQAIQFLSATYFQQHQTFCDLLTAVFAPRSPGAARLCAAHTCSLVFEAYAQRFSLSCQVWQLRQADPLFTATMAHNRLFNPSLRADSVVLGFEPDWKHSSDTSAAG